MKKRISSGLFLLGLIGFICLPAVLSSAENEGEIMRVLLQQKQAWNQGNIEGFMAYYWNSEDLTFQSGANRLRGWKALHERYKKSYPAEKMGQLDFTDLEVKVLSQDYAYVLGRWQLKTGEEQREGVFTLVLRRFPEGWRIIHDHTS